MSTTEHELDTQTTEAPETGLLRREIPVASVAIEGRTVDVRVVPFGEVARVADPPDFTPYDEEWLAGCFDHQFRAANRIHANVNHSPHVIDTVGHGLSLRSESDGYHASFEIHETQAGENALALIRAGALPSVSLEAIARKTIRTAAGVAQRVRADLRGVAFCREGAFKGAQVLAVRTPPEQIVDEALMPVDIDPERVERLRAQGIVLPDRYKAHPAETDTPAEAGTSDDGTRQTEENTSSEE